MSHKLKMLTRKRTDLYKGLFEIGIEIKLFDFLTYSYIG